MDDAVRAIALLEKIGGYFPSGGQMRYPLRDIALDVVDAALAGDFERVKCLSERLNLSRGVVIDEIKKAGFSAAA